MFPELQGKLRISLHGYRPTGARIVAPVGLTVASDGAIWVADDRDAAILRIAAEQ